MYVYLIAIIESGYRFKIGIAQDYEKRLKQLQTGADRKLEIKRTYKCTSEQLARNLETLIHKELGAYHTFGGKEWFNGDGYEAIKLAGTNDEAGAIMPASSMFWRHSIPHALSDVKSLTKKERTEKCQPVTDKRSRPAIFIIWAEETQTVTKWYADYRSAHAVLMKMAEKHPELTFHLMARKRTKNAKIQKQESSQAPSCLKSDAAWAGAIPDMS